MGCRCHDPAVFGHQVSCGRGAGPDSAGGHGRHVNVAAGQYYAQYPKRMSAAKRQRMTDLENTLDALISHLMHGTPADSNSHG